MLIDSQIKAAKPTGKTYRLYDLRGLYLEVRESGKYWRCKIRFSGQEKRLYLGIYPEVSLKEARDKVDDARRLARSGISPIEAKKQKKRQEDSNFKAVALEWYDKQLTRWSKIQAQIVKSRLDRFVFPVLGDKQIDSITPQDLLAALQIVEKLGRVSSAHRTKFICNQVFAYAVATGKTTTNPAKVITGALTPQDKKHFKAIIDPEEIRILLKQIDNSKQDSLGAALRLAPLLFVRPGELRLMKWSEIDLSNETWSYKVGKSQRDHIVPLSTQALEILIKQQEITRGKVYVFSSAKKPSVPIGEKSLNDAIKQMNPAMSAHGFRAMARTLLDEALGERIDLIEHQLGHTVKDPLGRAYNRTQHLPERRAMMQRWANYLDRIRANNYHGNQRNHG